MVSGTAAAADDVGAAVPELLEAAGASPPLHAARTTISTVSAADRTLLRNRTLPTPPSPEGSLARGGGGTQHCPRCPIRSQCGNRVQFDRSVRNSQSG